MSFVSFKNGVFKEAALKALKIPVFLLLMAACLLSLALINNFISLAKWKALFDLADQLATILIILAFVSFFYNLIASVFYHIEKKLTAKHAVASLILSSARKGLRIIFVLIALNILLMLFNPGRLYFSLANNVISTIIIASIGWIAVQIIYTTEAIINQYLLPETYRENVRAQVLYTKMHIIRNIATVLIIIITIAAILMSFSSVRNIGISLLASAGFLTAIVGIAAQKPLFSLFSGIQIALAQPIKIGDTVVIETISGVIEEITFTFVILKLGDRRRLVVPIQFFIEKPFENWSRDLESLQTKLSFFVDYMLPISSLRETLTKILQNSTYWDGKVSKLHVTNITDRSVEISVQLSAENPDYLAELRAEVNEKMLEFIRQVHPECLPRIRLDGRNLLLNSKT